MMPESGYETASIVGYLLRSWQQNALPDDVTMMSPALIKLYVSALAWIDEVHPCLGRERGASVE